MLKSRTSVVGILKIRNLWFSSILQIGDSQRLLPESTVLAVQRSRSVYYGKEGDDFGYTTGYWPPFPINVIEEEVDVDFVNESPFIKVGVINIQGVSTSGIVQIGSNRGIDSESKTRHIRQYILEGFPFTIGYPAVQALKALTAGAPTPSTRAGTLLRLPAPVEHIGR